MAIGALRSSLSDSEREVRIEVGGENEEMRRSFRDLAFAFGLALLLVYMILAAQFRSYSLPFVILLTVPFAFIGVVLGLFVTGNPFTITAGIAMIGLAGIAVNDAIVLVDFINQRRERGMRVIAAVVDACRIRARPILLTSVTTIAGLLPMALGLTGFSKLWSPFAATITFGLSLAMLLTLYLVPAVYLILARLAPRAMNPRTETRDRAQSKPGPRAQASNASAVMGFSLYSDR